ncbi:hypothetical protein [Promicromonospora sp. NFX87]|uniref:hypothetical protein n=1 Tax=Promicromonospora sp. NFX87 TaxID=3402691 RepID=UPI003AFA455E
MTKQTVKVHRPTRQALGTATGLARRFHEAEEPDPDVEFAFGPLDRVLDGLAARVG